MQQGPQAKPQQIIHPAFAGPDALTYGQDNLPLRLMERARRRAYYTEREDDRGWRRCLRAVQSQRKIALM